MKDSEDNGRLPIAFPVSELTRRLLRRADEPVGMINVRHAADLHARSNLWPGQRLELLDNFKSRYGLDRHAQGKAGVSPLGAGGMPLIGPLERMAAISFVDLASASPLVSRAAAHEAEAGADSHSSPTSPTPQLRVKRPNTRAELTPSQPLPSDETVTTPPPAVGEIRVSANPIPAMHLQRRTSETPSPVSSEPQPSALPLVHGLAFDTPRNVHDKLPPVPHDSVAVGPLPQIGALPRITVGKPMHLQRVPEGSAAAEEIGHFSTPHGYIAAPIQEDPPGEASSALDSSSSSGSLAQRQADHPAALPAVNPVQTVEMSTAPPLAATSAHAAQTVTAPPLAGAKSQSLRAVSAEIGAATSLSSPTSIVWRKADGNGAGGEIATPGAALAVGTTYRSGPQIMREVAPDTVSGISVAPLATAASGSNGADVAGVAEQVSRIIARQLRIERERRGRT